MTELELLDLKDNFDKAKTTVAERTGHQTALLIQFKDDWQCKTITEAKVKREAMDKELIAIDKKIKEKTVELEKLLNLKEE